MPDPIPPPILPRDGLDLDATEAHCRQGWHVPPTTALGLIAMVRRLQTAVQHHYDQRGDNRCWQDDLKLYHDALGIEPDPYVAAALAEWDREHPAGATEDVPTMPDPEPSPRPEPSEPLPSCSDRLRFDHDVSETSPVVVGTWVTAAHIVSLIVDGWTWANVLRIHPEITEDDIRACLAYTIETDRDQSK